MNTESSGRNYVEKPTEKLTFSLTIILILNEIKCSRLVRRKISNTVKKVRGA